VQVVERRLDQIGSCRRQSTLGGDRGRDTAGQCARYESIHGSKTVGERISVLSFGSVEWRAAL
jgi:hypothetical protein